MKKNILFVGSNSEELKDYNSAFANTEYTLLSALESNEAIKVLQLNRIDLIIVNLKGDGNESVHFLKKIKRLFPVVVRIVTSTAEQEEHAFKCIQNNLCKLYLVKPYTYEKLASVVNQILELQDILSNKELLYTINSIDSIPTLPDLYIRMNQLLDDDAGVGEIADLIEGDPAVSLQVLKVANSAFFGAKTGSVRSAIVNLGLINVKSIILTTGIIEFLNIKGFNKDFLWRHALITNKIISVIYKNLLKKPLGSINSSAGILHDIGRFVLFKNYPKNYEEIFDMVLNQRKSFIEAEKEVLKISHEEVGAYLLNWWDIPNSIVEAALYHDNPMLCGDFNKELVCVVHIADYFAWKIVSPEISNKVSKDVFQYLGFTKHECEDLVSEISFED